VKPGRTAWPLALALLAFAGLAGCRAGLPPTQPPTAVFSAAEVLARLQNRERGLESFQARGRITFLSPERNYSGTVLLKGRRPAALRTDILDLLGRTLLSFATDGDQVQVLSPNEGKFFHGPASPRNLAAFIPPGVSLPQALRLLAGALPLSPGPPSRFEYDSAGSRYLLEWRQNDLLQERLWVAAQGLYPVKDEYFGGGDRPRFTAELADFGEAAPELPGKITLKTEAPKLELRLAYKELRLNPPLTPAEMTLTPPPGVAVVQLP
jgi:outer membrane lipoprotein-sorting protein